MAEPKNYKRLWQNLREKFGPGRKETKEFPEIHQANSFVGNVVRLEILSRYGLCRQILDESIDYLLYMAEKTGTLWENVDTNASCNHGFASHIVHTLYRDVLGIYLIDVVNKVVQLRFTDLELNWCEGIIPLENGNVELRWKKDGEKILYHISAPAGYTVEVENISSSELVRLP